jgi:hypothetical protein
MTIKNSKALKKVRAGVKTAALAGLKTATQKVPVLSPIVTLLANIDAEHRRRRLEALGKYLDGDADGDDFATTIEETLRGPNRSLVHTAVLSSARAAVDAIDDVAIPTIALLTRLYVQTQTPDRVVYEELLQILKSIERDVFIALGGVFAKVSEIFEASGGFKDMYTTFRYEADVDDLAWCVWQPRDTPTSPGEAVPRTILLQGDLAKRAVSTLLGGHRGAFERDAWPQKPGPSKPGERQVTRSIMANERPNPDFRADVISLVTSVWRVPD